MISGFSGLPKFRQFVAATGVAPVQATLRAASATACIAPSFGSSQHHRPFPASAIANPRSGFASLEPRTSNPEPGLIRITPASPPGPCTVLLCTIESYCSYTHRLSQIFALASSFFRSAV